ncbi:hypothetical protein, partial [Salmonella sp. s58867]|uniref:hypothetical protein n=1 Tax=Salmonella sp. s58867 TaxID=3159710 RepID=UPI00397EC7D5
MSNPDYPRQEMNLIRIFQTPQQDIYPVQLSFCGFFCAVGLNDFINPGDRDFSKNDRFLDNNFKY